MTSRIPHHIEAELRARAEQRENRRAVDLSQYVRPAEWGDWKRLPPLRVVPPNTGRAEEDRLLAAGAVCLVVGALVGCAVTVAVMGVL